MVFRLYSSLFFLIKSNDFQWELIIVFILFQGLTFFPAFNKTELIKIQWNNNDTILKFTYYNILDKIVTEQFDCKNLKYIRVLKRIKRIKIELIDHRVINLDYTKNQELDVLNARLDPR